MRWPAFERNVNLAFWIAILLMIIGSIAVVRIQIVEDRRAAKQHQQELKALENKNAISVTP
jgi:hypothetical protein